MRLRLLHHFRNKETLCAACDDHVVQVLRDQLSRMLGIDATSPEGLPIVGAAMLGLLDPDPAGPEVHGLAQDGLIAYLATREQNPQDDPSQH